MTSYQLTPPSIEADIVKNIDNLVGLSGPITIDAQWANGDTVSIGFYTSLSHLALTLYQGRFTAVTVRGCGATVYIPFTIDEQYRNSDFKYTLLPMSP